MAKLANTIINVKNGDFKYRRELRTNVSSSGIFSVEFPKDLKEAFLSVLSSYNKKLDYHTDVEHKTCDKITFVNSIIISKKRRKDDNSKSK